MIQSLANSSHIYQVFFLPKEDILSPTHFVAVCPFTGIIAEGRSVLEAARKWEIEAKNLLQESIFIPKYVLTSRKIWYGYKNNEKNTPVYIMDFNFTDQALAFCPLTQQYLLGSIQEWKSENKSDKMELLPSIWVDVKVTCTPIFRRSSSTTETRASTQHHSPSITPHCINV